MESIFGVQWEATPFTSCCPQPQLPIQKAKRQQMDMIAELKRKQMVKEPLIYEGKDGAIEDIISGERLFQVSSWASSLQQTQRSVPAGRPSVMGGCGGLSQPGAGGPPSPIVGTKPTCSTFLSHAAQLPSALCPVS